jgi:hypothetical protein
MMTHMTYRYGSVFSTHLLKTPELTHRISSVILVDPVSILLHQPDVAYNFVSGIALIRLIVGTDVIQDGPDTQIRQ